MNLEPPKNNISEVLYEAARLIAFKLNAECPINRNFPDEILVGIFSKLVFVDRLVSSRVCQRWRRAARCEPRLWHVLSLAGRCFSRTRPDISELLARSKAVPLSLTIFDIYEEDLNDVQT